ncbi:MAG TPA: TetR family transcriptional regulator [Acidimicrobiia bacterium]|nr:TetR family transcriptional regulator [Acidimicrobiia bacterium]
MTARPARGRRPGDPAVTRRAVLEAARATFAEAGYERATIRAIASAAGVDPALVHHYFGTKEELFVAAHELPLSPAAALATLADDEGTLGERVTRAYLSAALTEGGPFESLVRAAMTNPTARAMLRRFIERGMLDTLAPYLGTPDARLRLILAGSHLMGLFMARQVLGVDALREADPEQLVRVVGPTIDRYLTGYLPSGRVEPVGLTDPAR